MDTLLKKLLKRGYNAEIRIDTEDDFNDTFIDIHGVVDNDYIQVEFSEKNGVEGTLLTDELGEIFTESRSIDDIVDAIECNFRD